MEHHIHLGGILIAAVFFLVEFFIDQKEHRQLYRRKETRHNMTIGIGLIFIAFAGKAILLFALHLSYSWRLFSIAPSIFNFLILFALTDFSYYWYHRCSHTVNWFWASHVVHHSAEYYNLSLSFRQAWTTQLSGAFLFWLWLPLLGFHPLWIFICHTLCNLYQSWLHTELINKLHPAFEFVFNTPSHHRVHHSSNIQYLDKNHGGVFIIWDRLLGTFEQEKEKPKYGLTSGEACRSVSEVLWKTWKQIFVKVQTGNIQDRLNYIFRAPGWSADGSTKTVKQMRRLAKKELRSVNKPIESNKN